MRTIEYIARQWERLGVALCSFCESPIDDEEEENHRCLADQHGCGCGPKCPIKEDKCGCIQCWG